MYVTFLSDMEGEKLMRNIRADKNIKTSFKETRHEDMDSIHLDEI
jgi:hypothetical protein